jgi:hypothetical protein
MSDWSFSLVVHAPGSPKGAVIPFALGMVLAQPKSINLICSSAALREPFGERRP